MFPVGVILASLGYAVAYYGVAVLKWVHDPAHPNNPPSLQFLLGASSTPGKPFTAPVNTEGAADPFAPFGAASGAAGGTNGAGGAAPAATAGVQPAPASGGFWSSVGGFLTQNVNPRAPGN